LRHKDGWSSKEIHVFAGVKSGGSLFRRKDFKRGPKKIRERDIGRKSK